MKTTIFKRLFLAALIFFFAKSVSEVAAQPWLNQEQRESSFNLNNIQSGFNEYWKDKTPAKGSGWKAYKRLEWFWEQRLYPEGTMPDINKIYNEYNNYLDNNKKLNQMQASADWKFLGPTTKPQQSAGKTPPGIGRINCIAFDPTNNNIIWAGAAFAGVWKSLTTGTTWDTFSQTEFMSVGVSDIAVNPSDGNIVYVATGDAESGGFFGQNFTFSIGVLKTTNGGTTWTQTGLQQQQSTNMLINRLLINPTNPQILYAAANTGLYKTSDAGDNWTQISTEYCRDIEFQSNNPNVVLGAFYSSNVFTLKMYNDADKQWSTTYNFNAGEISRINLATTKAGETVYALAAGSDMGFHSLLKSTNNGLAWTKVNDKSKSPNYMHFFINSTQSGGQGMYDLSIAVSPTNADEVYIGGVNIYKSNDGGKSFVINAEWTAGYNLPWVHADIHYLAFSPNGTLYAATDGGVNSTSNGGSKWTDLSNGLSVMQFYRLATSKTDDNFIIAGAQDNGTNRLDNGIWKNIQGGDGMECLIDYTESKYVYASLYYGELTRSTDGGNTFVDMFTYQKYGEQGAWVTPMIMHPTDPKILYAGLHNIWKTTNRGVNWGPITNFSGGGVFRCMAIATSNPNYIYASAGGQLLWTTNGGTTWSQLTQFNKTITYICIDPKVHNRLWVTLSGYTAGTKVMKYENGSWSNISGSLPNVPVNCIVYQANSTDRLYIGTDVGVFTRDKSSVDWGPFQTGMPPVVVNELEIHYGGQKLRAATYARGLWETKLSDCNLESPSVTITGKTTLCKGDSVILECLGNFVSYKWSNGSTGKKLTVKTDGTYSCLVTDSKSCTAVSDEVTITVVDPPDIAIKALSAHPFCEGDSVELSGPSLQYKDVVWSDGQTGRKIFVKKPGQISATGTTSTGCSKTSPVFTVEMYPKPAKPTISVNNDELISSDADAYQWYLNGNSVAGATQKNYKPAVSGKYHVEITDNKGCKNISEQIQFGTEVVNELNESSVNVSPNPAFDRLSIEIKNFSGHFVLLEISNVIGEIVYKASTQINSDNFRTSVYVRNLPDGTYFLKISSANQSYYKTIIKN